MGKLIYDAFEILGLIIILISLVGFIYNGGAAYFISLVYEDNWFELSKLGIIFGLLLAFAGDGLSHSN
jgi:hypothetical protein